MCSCVPVNCVEFSSATALCPTHLLSRAASPLLPPAASSTAASAAVVAAAAAAASVAAAAAAACGRCCACMQWQSRWGTSQFIRRSGVGEGGVQRSQQRSVWATRVMVLAAALLSASQHCPVLHACMLVLAWAGVPWLQYCTSGTASGNCNTRPHGGRLLGARKFWLPPHVRARAHDTLLRPATHVRCSVLLAWMCFPLCLCARSTRM